jgi:hypothetical protein
MLPVIVLEPASTCLTYVPYQRRRRQARPATGAQLFAFPVAAALRIGLGVTGCGRAR